MQGHGALRNRLSRCLTLLVRQWHCNLTTDTTMPETAGVNLMASTERGEKALLPMRLIEDARCDPAFSSACRLAQRQPSPSGGTAPIDRSACWRRSRFAKRETRTSRPACGEPIALIGKRVSSFPSGALSIPRIRCIASTAQPVRITSDDFLGLHWITRSGSDRSVSGSR
jgi:hypothetical protein